MEAASKNQPASALMEVRLENVAFSETCPICGNRKRRCLLPPTRSRKKRWEEPSPSSSRSAGLSVMLSQPPQLRSHPAAFRPPQRTVAPPSLHPSPRSVPATAEAFPQPTVAPPSPRSVPAPPDRWLKRSNFNTAKTELNFVVQGNLNVSIHGTTRFGMQDDGASGPHGPRFRPYLPLSPRLPNSPRQLPGSPATAQSKLPIPISLSLSFATFPLSFHSSS